MSEQRDDMIDGLRTTAATKTEGERARLSIKSAAGPAKWFR
jgi:hypothetical protein